MGRLFLSRIFVAAAILAAAVLWLLSVLPDTANTFAWFNLAFAGAIISGALGTMYVLRGAFAGADVVSKKATIFFGAGFLVLTLFCISWAIAMPQEIILPIVAIILTGALFVGILFTGGKYWDSGDNQSAGYKTYRERKAEEQKRKDSR
jgi:hypothetical protein